MRPRYQIKILNRSWRVQFWGPKQFVKKWGPDIAGLTETDERTINFHLGELSRMTAVHELVHAYMKELCVWSADLDEDQKEEVFAELLARHGGQLLRNSDRVLKLHNRLSSRVDRTIKTTRLPKK